MAGIWSKEVSGRWRPVPPSGYANEDALHDLIEQAPEMLPIAGSPELAILGREVWLGNSLRADLVAVEIQTGRPVIIEIKLAGNADRRHVLSQILEYASFIRRLDIGSFSEVLRPHLEERASKSIADAAYVASQDSSFDTAEFQSLLADALLTGRLRCVVVLDAAVPHLIDVMSYLQEMTSDLLSLDLVMVQSYQVGNQQVLVPQLMEADPSPLVGAVTKAVAEAVPIRGSDQFANSIAQASESSRAELRRLFEWMRELEERKLAILYTVEGKGRWALHARIPGQDRAMVSLWNANKSVTLTPYRSVMQSQAPLTLAHLDSAHPGSVGPNNSTLQGQDNPEILRLLEAAYLEASGVT